MAHAPAPPPRPLAAPAAAAGPVPAAPRPLLQGFTLGAGAACIAATFTNPMEVVKTRLQLQGELMRRHEASSTTSSFTRVYRSAPHAFGVILRSEGVRGLQRGLFPAYLYQCVMNGIRLGGYEPVKHAINAGVVRAQYSGWAPVAAVATNVIDPIVPVLSGFTCGIAAALCGSPLFLVKTRLQAYSSDPRLAGIGAQHRYKSTAHAMMAVVKEGGVKNLWRGATASMMRTGVGSAVQLSSYDAIKNALKTHHWLQRPAADGTVQPMFGDGIELHFSASMLTGLLVAFAMNPFDTVSTRLYNQAVDAHGRGVLYTGPMDCFAKTIRAEGVAGLYKGFTAHWLRVGPHTILTFVFLEQLRSLADTHWMMD
ncbi:Mitochondrial oxaloacetate carrier protein [Allomyces javanicus]|nr:Mitochondrial oxaloacetate carrier protein [Allomyces javanicus]